MYPQRPRQEDGRRGGRKEEDTLNNNLVLLLIVVVASGILAALGIWEKRKNEKCLKQLKIRVNVNGIRGKSTATRMITAILKEAGYQVIGKTTGTAARMIYWDSSEETEIKRRPRGVSISEQIRVIRQATKYGADALVCECMAVRPEYQKVYQHDIIKANVTVIVNVREDHLDEMGPTLEQLAWAFGETIPYNGIAVIPRGEFEDYFKEIARKRSTKAVVVDETQMPTRLLQAYDYKVFPNNCAVAIYTAMALNIPMDQIVAGVLKAQPDPGALRIMPIRGKRLETWFVNAFGGQRAGFHPGNLGFSDAGADSHGQSHCSDELSPGSSGSHGAVCIRLSALYGAHYPGGHRGKGPSHSQGL